MKSRTAVSAVTHDLYGSDSSAVQFLRANVDGFPPVNQSSEVRERSLRNHADMVSVTGGDALYGDVPA